MSRFKLCQSTRRPRWCHSLGWLAIGLTLLLSAAPLHAEPLTVFAAASLTNALEDVGQAFAQEGFGPVRASFAASSTQARQIENGAPADLFVSADRQWMDYLEERHLLAPASRVDLLANRLVLVAPADSTLSLTIAPNFPLAQALGEGRLAVGDPESVPVGRYAKAALVKLGVWDSVASKLAPSDSVRSALFLVERHEAPLGIVYTTDARISAKVRVVATFPENSHPPIAYPVAILAGHDTPDARRFLAFLRSERGKAVFEGYGFVVR